jgi:hypothetical protein
MYGTFAVAEVEASPVVGPEIVITGGVVSASSQVIADASGTKTRKDAIRNRSRRKAKAPWSRRM